MMSVVGCSRTVINVCRYQPCCGLTKTFRCYSSLPPGAQKLYDEYETFLKKYPRIYKVHRTIVDGSKSSWEELKLYWKVTGELRAGKEISAFSREELETYVQTPKDLVKIPVIVFLCVLPMTVVLLAVALIFFPRLLLTRHFWTPEQTIRFRQIILDRRKQYHYRQITNELFHKVSIEKGLEFQDLLMLNNMFYEKAPLDSLSFFHRYHLCRAHGIFPLFNADARLEKRAEILRMMDQRLKQKGLRKISQASLSNCLFIRQLPSTDLATDKDLLTRWIAFTGRPSVCSSLIMHAPVLRTSVLKKKE